MFMLRVKILSAGDSSDEIRGRENYGERSNIKARVSLTGSVPRTMALGLQRVSGHVARVVLNYFNH